MTAPTTTRDRPEPSPSHSDGAESRVPARPRWRPPGLDFLFTAVFALFGFGVGIERLSDNSFFIHLVTGRFILDHGIPREDTYSFTAPGTKFVAQSWLAELLYGVLDRSFGPFGIRVLGALTGAAITVLAFRLALRLSRERMRAALISVAALSGLYVLWSERPLLLGLLFFMILLWIVEVPDCWVGRHPYVSMPVVFWLWANVHGSFALGFAYLGLHLLGRWLDGARPWQGRERTLFVGAAIAGAATFVNPYGPELVFFPYHLLQRGDILRHIIEWASPNFHNLRGQALLLWLGVYVVVAARGRNRFSRRDVVVTVPFLGLALWALRNVAIAPLVCLPVVARAIAVDPERAARTKAEERRGPIGVAFVVVLVIIASAIFVRAFTEADFVTVTYPVKAMNAVEREDLIGRRLLMDDGDAAYAVLGFPGQKVFIDDRYDMFPEKVIYDFFDLSSGARNWAKVLDRYDVEVVVWPRREPLTQLMERSGDWTKIHRDDGWVVFVRNDLAP
jgi:hypothetical protein